MADAEHRAGVRWMTARVAAHADGYLRRGDFSRWIADVFGDHALARDLQAYERAYLRSGSRQELERVVEAVRSRYDLTDENGLAA